MASRDAPRADRAERLIAEGGTISVQVLNGIANVSQRKMRLSWDETHRLLSTFRGLLLVVPVTLETHAAGTALAERYGFAIYDSMIAGRGHPKRLRHAVVGGHAARHVGR